MAAKPPKPPTTNNCIQYDNNNSHNQQIPTITTKINNISSSSTASTPTTATSPSESSDGDNSVSISSSSNYNNIFSNINLNQSNQKNNCNNLIDCSCTNISIMQLFHEMKQEFPTVPDHIVNQCVLDNCHDRETCIKNLKRELATHPNTVQSYPAQILRNQNQNQNVTTTTTTTACGGNNKMLLKPTRPAPVPIISKVKNNKNSSNNVNNINSRCNLKNIKNYESDKTPFQAGGCKTLRNNVCNIENEKQEKQLKQDQQHKELLKCDGGGNNENSNEQQVKQVNFQRPQIQQTQKQPKRPTTLSFREPFPQNQSGGFQENRRTIHKPIRRAPLPPICKPQQHQQQQSIPTVPQQPSQQMIANNLPAVGAGGGSSDQSYSSASIQSPLSFSDSGESEISVNISLSPSSERSRGGGGGGGGVGGGVSGNGGVTRRTTSITVQPEPPYTRDFISQQSPRSFTSLNLTLRKPSGTPQSPIDITAGPGLTYYSSSFDARHGYQKSFHITVTDQGGSISASRIRPRTMTSYNVPAATTSYPEEEEISDSNIQSPLVNASPHSSENYPVYSPQQDVVVGLIQRQKNRKDALARCIQKNKQKLERVQNEIRILTLPVMPGESERLDSEIERLRCDCENILQEIENTKRTGMPSNELGYYNDNEQLVIRGSGGRQQQQIYYPQPPRLPYYLYHQPPAPPSSLSSSLHYHQSPSAPPDDLLIPTVPGIRPRPQPPAPPPSMTTTTVMLNQQQLQPSQQSQQYIDEMNPDGGPPWTCSMCTFQNHPLLNKCECCENVRVIPEPVIRSREDIHIHLSPGENRVIHSWIVS